MFHSLKIYTVHVKPGAASPQEQPVFVREGFNWMAFLFTGLWTLYQRLWWPTLFVVGFNAVLMKFGQHLLSSESIGIAQLGFQLLVGYLGNDWIRARLKRQGYILADITAADSQPRAEQRYFERYLAATAAQ